MKVEIETGIGEVLRNVDGVLTVALTNRVTLDGVDVSRFIEAVGVECPAHGIPRVVLRLFPSTLIFDGEAVVTADEGENPLQLV